jgi:hypothetical protein
MDSPSSGERTGRSPNHTTPNGLPDLCVGGVGRPTGNRGSGSARVTNQGFSRTLLERVAGDGESPVDDRHLTRWVGT